VRRRLLLLFVLGLLGTGAAMVVVQARAQAGRVEADLSTARDQLARAGGLSGGALRKRLALVDRAEAHARAARARLDRWPLRQLGAVPVLGRDVRVAAAVTASAADTIVATRKVVTAVSSMQAFPLNQRSIGQASTALLRLSRTLDAGREQVRSTRPLLTAADARARYLEQAGRASASAARAGQGLRLAARLYGPAGTARYFLAFQNPAELRGTGGLIGEYGILESSPSGPELTTVDAYQALDAKTKEGVRLSKRIAERYERLAINQAWSSVNIPPDMPTVGRIITRLYPEATGDRIDGVIAADPIAVASILRASGPIQAGDIRLTAENVADETLVRAYVRYADDNQARKRFLEWVARATFDAFERAVATHPVDLIQGLAEAARGRHLQLYSNDPAGQIALLGLGLAGTAMVPAEGDYLMAVGVNAGGNKLDAFMHRTLSWRVRLSQDGSADAVASLTLHNDVPRVGMPRYVVGPFDRRFRAGVNEQILTLYVAGNYGFTQSSIDGEPIGAEAQDDLGGVALTQALGVPAGRSRTLTYHLTRPDAATRVDDGRLRYSLLLRPQASVWPDKARVTVTAPSGWRFISQPSGTKRNGSAATWSGALAQEYRLVFELVRA
jgi:hypothetical protein